MFRPDGGGSKHLWNVGRFVPDYRVQRGKTAYRLHTRRFEGLKSGILSISFTSRTYYEVLEDGILEQNKER
jgi:hypothetical protein